MDLRLYGICFKLRGGPALLDHVLSGEPVPVDVMGQVMNGTGSISKEEMDFAVQLDDDWKKAFGEKVPLIMTTMADGGYDISCEIPDELIGTVNMLTGLSNEKIVEEYVSAHLKDVCGIEAEIISVDVEETSAKVVAVTEEPQAGFDLGDLDAEPEGPMLEDITELGSMGIDEAPAAEEPEAAVEPAMEEPEMTEEPVIEGPEFEGPADEGPEFEEPGFDEEPEGFVPDDYDDGYDEDYDGELGEVDPSEPGDELAPDEAGPEEDQNAVYNNALTNIYTELVENVRARRLDERLGLRIGQ